MNAFEHCCKSLIHECVREGRQITEAELAKTG